MRAATSFRNSQDKPWWLILPMLACYFVVVALLFFYWVQPSLIGENTKHITADSGTYIFFADALREGNITPYVASSLYGFPNTLWGATLLALLLPDTFYAMLVHLAMFCLALWLFSKAVEIDSALFLFLLALNPTTTMSLMAVNKELLDLLSLALFVYFLRHRSYVVLVIALLVSLVSRFETAATMIFFLFFRSRWNPLRERRGRSLIALTLALNFGIALLLASPSQAMRLNEAELAAGHSGGTSLVLTNLERHFLFFLVTVPKIVQNLFGILITPSAWTQFSWDDPANSYILLGNNLANIVILAILLLQRRLTLRSSIVYYAALIAITMSVAPVVQPRYFYGMYVLLCLEAARHIQRTPQPLFARSANAVA